MFPTACFEAILMRRCKLMCSIFFFFLIPFPSSLRHLPNSNHRDDSHFFIVFFLRSRKNTISFFYYFSVSDSQRQHCQYTLFVCLFLFRLLHFLCPSLYRDSSVHSYIKCTSDVMATPRQPWQPKYGIPLPVASLQNHKL